MVATADESTQRIGATLRGKWVLEELLGVGGMASVYAARHKIGRRDAIKILHSKVASSEQLRARFEQEAHAVNAFKHPGVVEIRDVDTTEDGAPFLVMELLEGESLAQRVDRQRSMQPREIFEIGAHVLDVLAAAHARGIIHRDIKPDNVFLSKDGRVKVLDFGIARVRAADRKALTTKAGVTIGTMAYMAPEQARGEEIDGRADVYAVGATMFRAMAGRFVHDADSQAALVMRVIAFGAPRLATVMPGVAPSMAAVVDRSLAFNAADRYPDAVTMLADIRAVLDGKEPPYASTAPPLPERTNGVSLFDETSSEQKGKPTVVPRARQQAGTPTPLVLAGDASAAQAAERAVTVIGGTDLPPSALPSRHERSPSAAAAATRVSPAGLPLPAMAVPTAPPSERVVIVPSQRGASVRSVDASVAATVHGLAPSPNMVTPQASSPRAMQAPVLTPFGELSAFVHSKPSLVVLAVGAGAALLAVVLMIVAIVWFASGATSAHVDATEATPPAESAPTGTAATTQTGPAPLPSARAPASPARPHRR